MKKIGIFTSIFGNTLAGTMRLSVDHDFEANLCMNMIWPRQESLGW